MSGTTKICDVDPEVVEKVKKFRLRKEKNIAAIVLKIDSEKLMVVEDEEYEDTSIDELVSELPEHVPRYVVLSYVYNHSDGRVSYPLCFIFVSPTSKPELQMTYAGSKLEVVGKLGFTKVFEIRSVEEFTEDWIKEKLAFFR